LCFICTVESETCEFIESSENLGPSGIVPAIGREAGLNGRQLRSVFGTQAVERVSLDWQKNWVNWEIQTY